MKCDYCGEEITKDEEFEAIKIVEEDQSVSLAILHKDEEKGCIKEYLKDVYTEDAKVNSEIINEVEKWNVNIVVN